MFGGLNIPLFVVGYSTCFGVAKAAKKPKRGIQNSMFEDVFVHFQPDMFMLLSPSLTYFQVLFLYFDDPNGFFLGIGPPPRVFSTCCSEKNDHTLTQRIHVWYMYLHLS